MRPDSLPRAIWHRGRWILLFNALFCAWLVARPGGHDAVAAVDDVAQFVGPLLALPLCVGDLPRRRARDGSAAPVALRWSPILLGLGILSFAVGQMIWTFYEQVLRMAAPTPSWADVAFLSAYPFCMLAILLLPARPMPRVERLRVALDGLMVMIGVATFSWYFVLGPSLAQSSNTLPAKIVAGAYPLGDLMLIACVLLLAGRLGTRALRPAARIMCISLVVTAITDTLFDYQTLHNTYATGNLLDVGWPLGYMGLGLAAYAIRLAAASDTAGEADAAVEARDGAGEDAGAAVAVHAEGAPVVVPPLWRALLPYVAIPAVGTLLIYAWFNRGDESVGPNVYVGAVALVVVVLLRQVLSIYMNRLLYVQLATHAESLRSLHQREHEARAAAETALRVRDHFLRSASHDLRTPLAMIMGRLERVELRLERGRAVEPAWLAEQTATMSRAAERMLSTVEEITDAAQLQIGQTLALRLAVVDLGEVVRAIAGMVADANTWPGAPSVSLETAEGVLVEGDRARLERVVQNIVGNAVKYSPHGTPVEVRLQVQEDERAVILTVRDHGVGIPPEDLPRLFTPFYRASTSIGIAGTGIGLAGCKAIVEQHDGQIAIASAPGEGTTVTVTLPKAALAPEGQDDADRDLELAG